MSRTWKLLQEETIVQEKIISHSMKTELAFLYGEICSMYAAPGLSSTKHIKIPFKHTLQFSLEAKAAPVLSSSL